MKTILPLLSLALLLSSCVFKKPTPEEVAVSSSRQRAISQYGHPMGDNYRPSHYHQPIYSGYNSSYCGEPSRPYRSQFGNAIEYSMALNNYHVRRTANND